MTMCDTACPRDLAEGKTARESLGVLVVDDSARSRQGLTALLVTCPALRIVGEASDGQVALDLVGDQRPDVVVMDVRMPKADGLAATRLIKQQWPEIRVIILSMYAAYRDEALGAGADVFLLKGCNADKLLNAILEG